MESLVNASVSALHLSRKCLRFPGRLMGCVTEALENCWGELGGLPLPSTRHGRGSRRGPDARVDPLRLTGWRMWNARDGAHHRSGTYGVLLGLHVLKPVVPRTRIHIRRKGFAIQILFINVTQIVVKFATAIITSTWHCRCAHQI